MPAWRAPCVRLLLASERPVAALHRLCEPLLRRAGGRGRAEAADLCEREPVGVVDSAAPSLVLDSLAAGGAVVVGDVTDLFDYSPWLKALLVEPCADDPSALHRRAVRVLEHVKQYEGEFRADAVALFSALREKASSSWRCF